MHTQINVSFIAVNFTLVIIFEINYYFILQELVDSKEAKESMNLSQEEKIQVCVDLAEALYQLHGYSPAFDKYDVSRFKLIGSSHQPILYKK